MKNKITISVLAILMIGCVNDSDMEAISQEIRKEDEFPSLENVIKVSTIGDSRFISFGGDLLRTSIEKNSSSDLLFVGSLQDSYGYNHDAVGGDGSPELMERYDNIPNADVYVILFGTNDLWMDSIDTPFETLSFIVNDKLSQGSRVYYCKQTPRDDYRDSYHIELDEAILNEFSGVEGFDVIDLRTPLLSKDNTFNYELYDDHVHPNNQGGKIMGREIANKINKL